MVFVFFFIEWTCKSSKKEFFLKGWDIFCFEVENFFKFKKKEENRSIRSPGVTHTLNYRILFSLNSLILFVSIFFFMSSTMENRSSRQTWELAGSGHRVHGLGHVHHARHHWDVRLRRQSFHQCVDDVQCRWRDAGHQAHRDHLFHHVEQIRGHLRLDES